MFVVRSAFWLGLALVMVGPPGLDLEAGAQGVADRAVAETRTLVTGHLRDTRCDSLECTAGKAVMLAALDRPPRERSEIIAVPDDPVPRPIPRPHWAG